MESTTNSRRLVFVHLSDIHFSAKDNGVALRNASLRTDVLNDIREQRERLGAAEALLVTGDIAFSGHKEEYRKAETWLATAAEAAGALPTSVLCVPGNHDVNWNARGPTGRTIVEKLRGCEPDQVDAVLDEFIGEPDAPVMMALNNYNDFAGQYLCNVTAEGHAFWQAERSLPRGYVLTIRGMTSVLSSDGSDRRGSLVVGTTQATLQQDTPCRVYLVLVHHSPDLWHDHDAVTDVLRRRARVMLSGHKHSQRIDLVETTLRVTAGAVHPEPGRDWEPRYNWLVLDVSDDNPARLIVQVWPRMFRPADNKFVADRYDAREYREEIFVLPQCTPEGEAVGAEDTGSTTPSDRRGSEEPVPDEALRPPLLTPIGGPDPERDVVRRFLQLTYPQQMSILQELGLLDAIDKDRRFVDIASAAIDRARDRSQIADLDVALREVESIERREESR